MGIRPLDVLVLLAYFGGMTWVGLYFAKRNKSTEEYFLGNRAFPGWVIGMSMIGTSISSISFLALPADAFKTNWLRVLPGFMLPIAVLMGMFLFMPFYRRTRATSAFEYLEARFGASTRMYGAVAFLVGQLFRISTILYLLSGVVHLLTGLPLWACIVVGGVFVSFYTVAGGIEAVVWTDVVQTIVLLVGGVLILAKIVTVLPGGLSDIFSVAGEAGKFRLAEMLEDGSTRAVSWQFSFTHKTALMMLVVGLTGQMTEHACDQNLVQRYCAAKSMREARKALLLCCCASIPIWVYFYFVGTSLYVFFQQFPNSDAAAMLTGANGAKAEQILPYFVLHYLPAGVSGLVLAGVAAAAMSSLDSSINAISTVSVVDIYRRHLVKKRDDRHYLLAARLIAVGASVFMLVGATLFAYTESQTLSDTTTALAAIVSGGLLGLYLLGFLTTRGNGRTVGVAIGFTVAWSLYKTLGRYDILPAAWQLPVDDYYTGIISHIIMFGVGFLVASLLPGKRRDLTNLSVWTQDGTGAE
jgi:solute:Na+ symporter, SSS family